ncbi:uncharacterized protein K02A2.6-like [Aedes albopictus]|uniref:Reverse transcriptase domain-containing protein n=1 Tax=Aedes albopictus TaxID=7160 RepID=A0ABM1ZQK0_AEDAL
MVKFPSKQYTGKKANTRSVQVKNIRESGSQRQCSVDAELDRLQKVNIITTVDFSEWTEYTEFVSLETTPRALQPHQYPLPLPEDIFAKLANCKVFSQIDLPDAFLQECEGSTRSIPATRGHNARWASLSGYLDDVLVSFVDEATRNLAAVLRRIREFGFTIKAEKCSLVQMQIKYFGHLIDEQGLRPDTAKIESNMQHTNTHQHHRSSLVPGSDQLLREIRPEYAQASLSA